MIHMRGPDQAQHIDDPKMRRLIERRFREICNGERYDSQIHGEITLADAGDTLESLEWESGCPIATNPFDETRFPDPKFVPVCEIIDEHATCYEMVFILNDDGFGVLIFVPKHPDIDRDLLSLCRIYAVKPRKRHRS
jgi:hypothetical protein